MIGANHHCLLSFIILNHIIVIGLFSAVGGEQAANVLATVQRNNLEEAGKEWTAEEEQKFKQPIIDKFEHESSAYYSTSNLWDDGIIDPADTRTVLGHSLAIARRVGCEPANDTKFGVFRM